MTGIVWFRADLRISDNPALNKAFDECEKVVAVYVHNENEKFGRKIGGASKWWLHYALKDLEKSLQENYNIELIILENHNDILELAKEISAKKIYWNRQYEPTCVERDKEFKAKISEQNIEVESFNGSLLVEPWEAKTGGGGYFKVFTAFYKSCLKNHTPREVILAPKDGNKGLKTSFKKSVKIEDLKLLPTKPNWAKDFDKYWKISEKEAQNALYKFLETKSKNYGEYRDYADEEGTSKLSPYLHFGQISPHQVLSAAQSFMENGQINSAEYRHGIDKYIAEIYWREFSYNLMFNFGKMDNENFREDFDKFPWENNEKFLKAWQKGLTGYPIVDAGIRELWATGWMHNRVRMIVGSLLTKHLLIHWKHGEEWFWDCLVDADLASNAASWQWVSGSGADASPYFRIFNPIMQGKKFDRTGNYVRKWVPELAKMPTEFIHNPWDADEITLRAAGVKLDDNYPRPIVSHEAGRQRALDAYAKLKDNK